MSANNDEDQKFGYGVDLKLNFLEDGSIDLAISETGDIDTVGGDGEANKEIKMQNVLQQMKYVLSTPIGSLLDENGNPVSYGSSLLSMIGRKLNDFNVMVMKSYVISAILSLEFIEGIQNVVVIPDKVKKDTIKKLGIYFQVKADTQKYYTEFEVGT